MTKNKNGAIISIENEIEDIKNPIKVKIIDKTGTGDAFFGTLLGFYQ